MRLGIQCGQLQFWSCFLAASPPHSRSFQSCLEAQNSTSKLGQIIRVSGQAKVVMKSRWVEFSGWGKERRDKKFTYMNIAGRFPVKENNFFKKIKNSISWLELNFFQTEKSKISCKTTLSNREECHFHRRSWNFTVKD